MAYALTHPETLLIQLLQLRPHSLVSAGLCESFPEELDGGGVGDNIGIAKEPSEADAVCGLPLQFGVE